MSVIKRLNTLKPSISATVISKNWPGLIEKQICDNSNLDKNPLNKTKKIHCRTIIFASFNRAILSNYVNSVEV